MPNDKIAQEKVLNKEEVGGEDEASAEEFKVLDEFPDEDEIEQRIESVGADVRISPFDPDFLLFALPLAFVTDIVDIILESLLYI